jgi:hypothetical protein
MLVVLKGIVSSILCEAGRFCRSYEFDVMAMATNIFGDKCTDNTKRNWDTARVGKGLSVEDLIA